MCRAQSGIAHPASLFQALGMRSGPLANMRSLLLALALAMPFLCLIAGSAKAWEPPPATPPGRVHLTNDWAEAQRRNADRLAAPPLDQLAFILDDVALKQHRKFAEYSGDISGRWIGAAVFLAPQFPGDFKALPDVMAGFVPCQKADGHFGADQQLPNIERQRDMPILWGNGRLLIGLVEQYDCTKNQKALVLARKLGDYFVATDPVYDRAENIRAVGGSYADGFVTCYFSCIEGLVGLARVTGDDRYLEEAKRIAGLALTVTNFDSLHSHGRLCAVRGFVDLYALTREPVWLQGAQRDWMIFKDRYLLPTGGVKEMLEANCVRDEGCAEADWLRLNLSLWQATGEGRYLDAAERSLRNHFLYQQFANGGAGHRVLHQVQGQPVAFAGLSEEAWWCCGEHWARAMVDVARMAVVAGSQALFINLAVDCDATVDGPGGIWEVGLRETKGDLKVRLNPAKPVTAEVRIHRPAWAQDGRVEAPKGIRIKADGDAWKLTGAWRGMQEVQVFRPMKLRVEAQAAHEGVFLAGNDVLAACPCPANAWLLDKLPGTRPTVLWSAALQVQDGRFIVPASLAVNPDPRQPNEWRPLELVSLRSQAAIPEHQVAWFSFNPRPADPSAIKALLASKPGAL
jgi:hypothetical protein